MELAVRARSVWVSSKILHQLLAGKNGGVRRGLIEDLKRFFDPVRGLHSPGPFRTNKRCMRRVNFDFYKSKASRCLRSDANTDRRR